VIFFSFPFLSYPCFGAGLSHFRPITPPSATVFPALFQPLFLRALQFESDSFVTRCPHCSLFSAGTLVFFCRFQPFLRQPPPPFACLPYLTCWSFSHCALVFPLQIETVAFPFLFCGGSPSGLDPPPGPSLPSLSLSLVPVSTFFRFRHAPRPVFTLLPPSSFFFFGADVFFPSADAAPLSCCSRSFFPCVFPWPRSYPHAGMFTHPFRA